MRLELTRILNAIILLCKSINLTNIERKLRALLQDLQFVAASDITEKRKDVKYIKYQSLALSASEQGVELWKSLD
jgi:hypothetical protein